MVGLDKSYHFFIYKMIYMNENDKSNSVNVTHDDSKMKGSNSNTTLYIVIGVVVATLLLCCVTILCSVGISAAIRNAEENSREDEVTSIREENENNDTEDDREIRDRVTEDKEEEENNQNEKSMGSVEEILTNAPFEYDVAQVSIDDDPILGDIDEAKVVIVEFSDYECPFCKRHHEQTYPSLVSEYIDTGEVAMVYRDFPLSFHDPASTKKANAAECVQSFGGDSLYFEYMQILYSESSVDNTITDDELATYAEDLGLDYADVLSCIEDELFYDEVSQDLQDGSQAGVTGTPGFIVGYLDNNGQVDGLFLPGAYPFENFAELIDYLIESKN